MRPLYYTNYICTCQTSSRISRWGRDVSAIGKVQKRTFFFAPLLGSKGYESYVCFQRTNVIWVTHLHATRITSTAMTDVTTKLSELLAAARGRRAMDDALGLKREHSTKTILSTANSKSYRCLLETSSSMLPPREPSSSASESSSGESPEDLAASMRLVRSYALRVKQMPPSPEPTIFGAFPPPRGDSFIDRGRERSFRDRFLSTEGGSLGGRRGSCRSEHLRRNSDESCGPPAAQAGLQRRLPAVLPSDKADKPVKPVARADNKVLAAPAARHAAVSRRRWSSMSDINSSDSIHARQAANLTWLIPDVLPHAFSASNSSKRFRVRGEARPSAQLTEEFCY